MLKCRTYDLTNVTDPYLGCIASNGHPRPRTETVIQMLPQFGIDRTTDVNWPDVWCRLELLMLAFARTASPVMPSDVRRHIGLSVSMRGLPSLDRSQFCREVLPVVARELPSSNERDLVGAYQQPETITAQANLEALGVG